MGSCFSPFDQASLNNSECPLTVTRTIKCAKSLILKSMATNHTCDTRTDLLSSPSRSLSSSVSGQGIEEVRLTTEWLGRWWCGGGGGGRVTNETKGREKSL